MTHGTNKYSYFTAVSISKPEEDRLQVENESLRKEIDSLKVQLILAEANNGG